MEKWSINKAQAIRGGLALFDLLAVDNLTGGMQIVEITPRWDQFEDLQHRQFRIAYLNDLPHLG